MLTHTRKQLALRLLKTAVILLVSWGIIRAIGNARTELEASEFQWSQLDLGCFILAAVFYFVAQIPMAWFWQQCLGAFGQSAPLWTSFRAFFVGLLGKYVPGKFMVVLMRSGLIGRERVDPVLAGVSVFLETLTGMACGAFLAATILFFWFPQQTALQALAIGLMLATVVGTLPSVMRTVVRVLQRRRGQPMAESALEVINLGLMVKGWVAAATMWALTTICFWWTLKGLPGTETLAFDPSTLARLAASVCLAVVAGFVSLIPGGLGIREWVLNQLLVPEFGQATALLAAVLLRLVMLLTEVIGSTILYLVAPFAARE